MNDIATASDRGRRTIYTYFRTKSDIYQAVIEDESARILASIEKTVADAIGPINKLRALMEYRVAIAVDNTSGAEVWIRSLFGRDIKRAERIRAMVTNRIYQLIDEITSDGIQKGIFIPEQCARLSAVVTIMVRGSDWTAVREEDSNRAYEKWRHDCIDFILAAVTKPEFSITKHNPNIIY